MVGKKRRHFGGGVDHGLERGLHAREIEGGLTLEHFGNGPGGRARFFLSGAGICRKTSPDVTSVSTQETRRQAPMSRETARWSAES
jgi:hypothetical protein